MSERFARWESSLRTTARERVPAGALAKLRNAAFAGAPPIVVEAIRRLRREWEYLPDGWSEEQGWNSVDVARAYRAALASIDAAITPTGTLGVPLEPHPGQSPTSEDASAHNLALTFGYVLARAARGRSQMSILDWGGGIGGHQLFARALLPEVEIEYHCKELPAVVAGGREAMPDVIFHVDDRCLDRQYDLVMASSSLQYERDWQLLLERLGRASCDLLFVARLPVTSAAATYAVRQRPTRYGYATTYVGWVVARQALLERAAEAGLALEREFLGEASFGVPGAPGPVENRSYLLRRRN